MNIIKASRLTLLVITGVILGTFSAHSQKYKTTADTARLNKEYTDDQKDLSDLKTKLDKANGKTSDYQAKVSSTSQDATSADEASKNQAATATNGNMSDVKKEEKLANKAKTDAIDSKDAQNNVKNNQKDIEKLNKEIDKKQKRLNDLDAMRTAINSNSMSRAKTDSTGVKTGTN